MGSSLQSLIRDLHRRRGRERRHLTLAEGVRLLEEAVAAEVAIEGVVTSSRLESTARGRALKAALMDQQVPTERLSDTDLSRLATTEQPQGIVAVLRLAARGLDDVPVGSQAIVLVLDGLQDPGNVGTIVRTALAFGVAGVIALPGTAELTNPKTLRATMGAAFRMPFVAGPEAEVAAWLSRHGIAVAATGADGDRVGAGRLPRPLALVLGNEGAGTRSDLARGAARRIAIPLAAGVDSLNVAVAAGILLHGVTRE